MRGYYIGTSSLDAVLLHPKMPGGFKRALEKKQSSLRTRAGHLYRVLQGSRESYKMTLEAVSSSDACRVNSWWGEGSKVMLWPSRGKGVDLGSGYISSTTSGASVTFSVLGTLIPSLSDMSSGTTAPVWLSRGGLWLTYSHSHGVWIHKYSDSASNLYLRACDASTYQNISDNVYSYREKNLTFAAGMSEAELSLWVNGILTDSAALTISPTDINSRSNIGGSSATTARALSVFKRFMMLDRLATNSEAWEYYTTGTLEDKGPVVIEYEFDDNAVDLSGNENHGTFSGVDCWYQVSSLQFMNKTIPLDQYFYPEEDLYKGAIELETY